MDLGLTESRVLITGGASNIGRGIVHGFARERARIVLCDIDGAQAEKVRSEALTLGAAEVELAIVDLTSPNGANDAVAKAVNGWGGLDVLVSNAGWSVPGFITEDTDRARWQKLVEVNLYGAIAATQAALAPMIEAKSGALVYVASEAAFGQIRQAVYGATKAAVVALARTTAREQGRHGIRANIVCPGLVVPDGPDAVGSQSLWAVGESNVFNDRQREYLLKDTPLQRPTSAEDIANTVVWLSSNIAARQVTGQLIAVSGGYTMP